MRLRHELVQGYWYDSKRNAILTELATFLSLPVLRDREDISINFILFERIPNMLNMDKSTYAVSLGSLKTGKTI